VRDAIRDHNQRLRAVDEAVIDNGDMVGTSVALDAQQTTRDGDTRAGHAAVLEHLKAGSGG
jgi:hypothetical protein